MNTQVVLLLNQAASVIAEQYKLQGSARFDHHKHVVVFEAKCKSCGMARRVNVPELKFHRMHYVKGVLGSELTAEVGAVIQSSVQSLRCPICDHELLSRPLPRDARERMRAVRLATGAHELYRVNERWDRTVREAMARIAVRQKFVELANDVGPLPTEKYAQIVHLHEGEMVVPAILIASADVTLCARWMDTQRAREFTPEQKWSQVLLHLRALVDRAQAARHEVETHASRAWESGPIAERWLLHELAPLLDAIEQAVADVKDLPVEMPTDMPIGRAPKHHIVTMKVEPGLNFGQPTIGAPVCVSASGNAMPLTRDEAVIGYVVGVADDDTVYVAMKD